MALISVSDLLKIKKLNKLGGDITARLLMVLLSFNKVNKLYSKYQHKDGKEFIHLVLKELKIKYEVNPQELKNIPEKGAFIIVANHPLGGLEGMILLEEISGIRPDFKILGNFLFKQLEPIKESVLDVNPFENQKELKSSIPGLRKALSHLREDKCLAIFPAGEVSSYQRGINQITDRKWIDSVIRFIKKAEVPVIPVYFSGKNSLLFYLLGKVHPLLRTAKIPSELFNKKNEQIIVRIGKPVSLKDQRKFDSTSKYGRFLRARTYALGTNINVDSFYKNPFKILSKPKPVIDAIDKKEISGEIKNLAVRDHLFDYAHYSVYCTEIQDIPKIILEIGRLRELTFRNVGEGTNRKIDLDEYDLYYHQLFIWDNKKENIVGAYRLGKGQEIVQNYGVKGFYTNYLFKIDKEFYPVLEKSIELGRSFITKEYQKNPVALYLLWKGIYCFLQMNPGCRYLIGPVSISNAFSTFSKSLITQYIRQNHFCDEFSAYIRPRKAFEPMSSIVDTEILMGDSDDLGLIDRVIKDVESNHFGIPVLLKKYLQLNGKIACFNVDPKFNDSLDGFLILDIRKIPQNMISSFSKGLIFQVQSPIKVDVY